MTAKILSAVIVLIIVIWLYLAVSYLKNKNGGEEKEAGSCGGTGCSGCAMRKDCGARKDSGKKPKRDVQ